MTRPYIQFVDVYKKFGNNVVLDGANFTINKGEITTIIGKSGVGKSVLLKHVIGLLIPDSGQVLFDGNPISNMKRTERLALRDKFSYMFQGTALFDSMTVYENVSLPLRESKRLPEKVIRDKVRDKMEQLELVDVNDRYPAQLSGGMKKRVALARALITDPETVLFDEPTTGLDPIRKDAVHTMISEYQKKFGFTGVVVSHEIPDVFYISQKIAFLNNGKIIFEGSPEEIQRRDDPEIRQFIHVLEEKGDYLTGLGLHTKGHDNFVKEMARLQRHDIPFSLALMAIESTSGGLAKAGVPTPVFQRLAALIQVRIRVNDTIYRHGVNRMVILLAHCPENKAWLFGGSLLKEFDILVKEATGDEACAADNATYQIKIGVAEAKPDSELESLILAAESTMEDLCEFSVR